MLNNASEISVMTVISRSFLRSRAEEEKEEEREVGKSGCHGYATSMTNNPHV